MAEKLIFKNKIPVAAHRGNSAHCPENTLTAFRSALALNIDMIELDLHMTKDGEIVMMHDHDVKRTTNGEGLVRNMTLAEIKALDAGSWKDEKFKGEQVPTFREFLELVSAYPEMTFNVELKDYPKDSGDFAYRSADKSIELMREYGIMERSLLNTWSGELNEYLHDKYGSEIRIHAYYPQDKMGPRQKQFVMNYAYCVCLFGNEEHPVVSKARFDFVKSYGVEPWVYFKVDTPEVMAKAIERGAMLFTANDPKYTIDVLREMGLHE